MGAIRFSSAVLIAFSAVALAAAQSLNTNLIVNPGGDVIDANGTPQVSTSFYFSVTDTATMFGWTVSGSPAIGNAPTTYRYDSTPGSEDYPLLSEGPRDANGNPIGGLNFFFGGFNGDGARASNAYQDIDLSGLAVLVDSGALRFELSGWIGGYYSQSDSVTISATCFDADGNQLGRSAIGPLTPADRGSSRNFFYRESRGDLPVGTRRVRIQMDFTGGGRSLDGYADNLNFSLSLRGDVTGDGCIDDADLLQVLFAFGSTGNNPADVNGDSIVDDADLLIVLFGFGTGC